MKLLLAFSAFVASFSLAEDWVTQLRSVAYRPVQAHWQENARYRFNAAYANLDALLRQQTVEIETGWRSLLSMPLLAKIAANESVTALQIDQALWSYFRNRNGIEFAEIIGLREALRSLRYEIETSQTPAIDLQRQFELKRDRLAALLAAGDSCDSSEAGKILGWMARTHQMDEWIPWVRTYFEKPNLQYAISGKLLLSSFEPQTINETQPLSANSQGVQVFGTTHFVGTTRALLAPNPNEGNIEITLSGNAYSDTEGHTRGAVVRASAVTSVHAAVRLLIHSQGLSFSPVSASAHTDSQIHSVDFHPQRHFLFPRVDAAVTRIGRRIVVREATRRQGEAEANASRQAEARIAKQFAEEIQKRVGDRMNELNRTYLDTFYLPLYRHEIFPAMHFSTTQSHVAARGKVAGYGQFATVAAAPMLPQDSDVTVQLHESALNNFFESAYGWFDASDEYIENMVKTLFGEVPPELWVFKGSKRWSAKFEKEHPIVAKIGANRLTLTFRFEAIRRQAFEETLPVVASATYDIVLKEGRPVFTQVGEPTITFIRDNRGAGGSSTLEEFARKKLLALFPPAPTFPNLMLPQGLNESGLPQLENTSFTIGNGWIAGSWKLAPKTLSR